MRCGPVLLLFLLFWTCTTPAKASDFPFGQTNSVSDQTLVSILTCGPGTDEYSLFGHSALRIKDPETGFDRVYNYGTFNPRLPYFVYHFVRGDLQYWVSSVSFSQFLYDYTFENRSVSEQVLALHPDEVKRLYNSLYHTLNSPAKYYRYQFFADNCSTRLFDLITTNVSKPLQFDSTGAEQPQTYRQLLAPYIRPFPWINVGINVALGLSADQQVGFRQQLFLPAGLEHALSKTRRGQQFLVAQTNSLFIPVSSKPPKTVWWTTPSFALLLLLFIVCLAGAQSTFALVSQRFLLFALGLLGCFLALVSVFSLHKPLQDNYQILWLLPSHLFFVIPKPRHLERGYATIALGSLALGTILAYGLSYLSLLPELWLVVAIIAVVLVRFYGRGKYLL